MQSLTAFVPAISAGRPKTSKSFFFPDTTSIVLTSTPFSFPWSVPRKSSSAALISTTASASTSAPSLSSSSSSSHNLLDIVKNYKSYFADVAKIDCPKYFHALLYVLSTQSHVELITTPILSPASAPASHHPFLIPLARNVETGQLLGLLRWPTPPKDFDPPVVKTSAFYPLQISLVAPNTKSYVTRALVALDSTGKHQQLQELSGLLHQADPIAAQALYTVGDVSKLGMGLERFLILKVGPFPDLYEGFATFHEVKKDIGSSFVTCEKYAASFLGFARPHCFHARILDRYDRSLEARDAARFALQMPLWTLDEYLADMADIAGYQDINSIKLIYKRLANDERKEDLEAGKAPEQIALDRAAYILDAHVAKFIEKAKPQDEKAIQSLTWESVRKPLADMYLKAKVPEVANFVLQQQ